MQKTSKTMKVLEKTKRQEFSKNVKDQTTSPLKRRKLSYTSFIICNRDPDILSMTRTLLKEETAQIEKEIEPLESEMERLKKFQEELQDQIMSSRLIEKQIAIKAGEIFDSKGSKKEEEANDLQSSLRKLKRDNEISYGDLDNEDETKFNKNKETLRRNINEKMVAEEMEEELNDDAFQRINQKEKNLFKRKPLQEKISHEEMDDFDKKWKLFKEKDEENNYSERKQSPEGKTQGKFNKENIDKLSDEIQELLNMQSQKIDRKNVIWGNLSEIKEASIEESLME